MKNVIGYNYGSGVYSFDELITEEFDKGNFEELENDKSLLELKNKYSIDDNTKCVWVTKQKKYVYLYALCEVTLGYDEIEMLVNEREEIDLYNAIAENFNDNTPKDVMHKPYSWYDSMMDIHMFYGTIISETADCDNGFIMIIKD